MTDVSGDWVGKILGTNNGDIFTEITQHQDVLTGSLRLNDPIYGTAIYAFTGTARNGSILFEMDPDPSSSAMASSYTANVNGRKVIVQATGSTLGHVSVSGVLKDTQRIQGKWTSSVGTGGTFWLDKVDSSREKHLKKDSPISENLAFVMMSISPNDSTLADVLNAIKRAAKQCDVEAVRVDEIEHSNKITEIILDKVRTSQFLICDISTERPNVYYELGFAHGIGKEVILLAREGTTLHFDVKDYNVIFYKSFTDLETRVANRIRDTKARTQT